ncbi:hypothetical protein TUM4637_35140 [Shewanella hafniensis]|uniref:SIR2 family protein n=1 Tax=Shewanella hafniensis TaxID=365590 RepID=UPI001BC124DB|nr:SIR2 family protein [Shewanella hafniensis]MCL1136024.1 SIR2 family protein [Shewanella hafniensis]GIU36655.1 hypothetical protein TUM4637_35140 [Shewanella hafniensis]
MCQSDLFNFSSIIIKNGVCKWQKKKQYNFPETIRAHLVQIAERLWSDRAVVMVGAGFSKNASTAYPSWFELGDILFEKAHGRRPDADEKSYLSLLKVAEDAEAVIKRPALDAVLMQHIPDNTVDPSALHETLLELPWADILTTNYDTLLERAQRKVTSRRYSTVYHQDDLAYQKKPRVIKLHGSFPSHRNARSKIKYVGSSSGLLSYC